MDIQPRPDNSHPEASAPNDAPLSGECEEIELQPVEWAAPGSSSTFLGCTFERRPAAEDPPEEAPAWEPPTAGPGSVTTLMPAVEEVEQDCFERYFAGRHPVFAGGRGDSSQTGAGFHRDNDFTAMHELLEDAPGVGHPQLMSEAPSQPANLIGSSMDLDRVHAEISALRAEEEPVWEPAATGIGPACTFAGPDDALMPAVEEVEQDCFERYFAGRHPTFGDEARESVDADSGLRRDNDFTALHELIESAPEEDAAKSAPEPAPSPVRVIGSSIVRDRIQAAIDEGAGVDEVELDAPDAPCWTAHRSREEALAPGNPGANGGPSARRGIEMNRSELLERTLRRLDLSGRPHAPNAITLADGSQALIWEDTVADDVHAIGVRVFGRDGSPLGAEALLTDRGSRNQCGPKIAALRGGGFVVAWAALEEAGEPLRVREISACVFDASGKPAGPSFPVQVAEDCQLLEHEVIALADGSFAVAWLDLADDGGWQIMLQCFTEDGVPRHGAREVHGDPVCPPLHLQAHSLANGNLAVTWQDWSPQAERTLVTGLRAAVYDRLGNAVAAHLTVSMEELVLPSRPVIEADRDGGFRVSWEGYDRDAPRSAPAVSLSRCIRRDGKPDGGVIRKAKLAGGADVLPVPAAAPSGASFVAWWDSLEEATGALHHPNAFSLVSEPGIPASGAAILPWPKTVRRGSIVDRGATAKARLAS